MNNIVFVGVPGAGKSTVGKLVADFIGWQFFDVDLVIETNAGKPISNIFTDDGEATFRQLEASTIAALLLNEKSVISLGGGALGNDETRASLKDHVVVWLQTGLSQAVDRVGMNRNRPLLLGNVRGQLSDLMAAREPIYRGAADITVDTSHLQVDAVTEAVVAELKRYGAVT